MAYIAGDIHGSLRNLIRSNEAHSLTSEDTIILLGDARFSFCLYRCDWKTKKSAVRISASLLRIGNREVRLQLLSGLYHENERFGSVVMKLLLACAVPFERSELKDRHRPFPYNGTSF